MRCLSATVASVALVACARGGDGPTGATEEAIVGGSPATLYPEAVVVTSSGFLPCSGVLLAPRVVLSAGHCKSPTKEYAVLAPNAGGQTATGSRDWTTFAGSAATSSDTLLIFLDTAITLDAYPVIPAATVAAGTEVVDVGRTLNGTISMNDYVSPSVTIAGTGTALGFPFNYAADPDLSQDGDSGGPIELAGVTPHTLVAIVDTDTVEQGIDAGTPVDLFARLDLVRSPILAQIAMLDAEAGDAAATSEAGSRDASEPDASHVHSSGHESADAASDDAPRGVSSRSASSSSAPGGGSCALAGPPARAGSANLAAIGLLASACWLAARRRRRALLLVGLASASLACGGPLPGVESPAQLASAVDAGAATSDGAAAPLLHAITVTLCSSDAEACNHAKTDSVAPYRVALGSSLGTLRTRDQAAADLYRELRDRTALGTRLDAESHHRDSTRDAGSGRSLPAPSSPDSNTTDELIAAAHQLLDAVDLAGEVTLDSSHGRLGCILTFTPEGGTSRCLISDPNHPSPRLSDGKRQPGDTQRR